MEESLKMRNLLQEFLKKHDGVRYPTILGVREHIFTGRYQVVVVNQNLDFDSIFYFVDICNSSNIYLLIYAVFHLLHGLCQIRRLVL